MGCLHFALDIKISIEKISGADSQRWVHQKPNIQPGTWSVTLKKRTSAIADARHQEVLPSANSTSKYGVTRSYLCCVRETFV